MSAAFTAVFSADHIQKVRAAYELRDSFILDSGATIHICNTLSRFSDQRPGSGSVMAGDTVLDIESWGTVQIHTQTNTGSTIISLLDVAYISTFHTNLVSLKKALAMGYHFDTRTMSIFKDSSIILTVKVMHDQFVAQYNACSNAFTSTQDTALGAASENFLEYSGSNMRNQTEAKINPGLTATPN